MDRLHSMRVFSRVVDEGSFARASRALNLSPAVVTRLVADLEDHLGSRLINRTTRRLSLTDTGEFYLERVRHILTEVDEAEALAKASLAEPRGHLRVLCPPAFAGHQLAKLLPRFRASYPRVSIELSLPGPVETIDENFDLSILIHGRRPPGGNVVARRLARSEVIVCASPGYLDRRGRPRHPKDLEAHDTVVPPFQRELVLHTCERADGDERGESITLIPGHSGLVTGHTDTMYAAALAGLGITCLPSFVAEDALTANTLERVLPQWLLSATTLYAGLPSRPHVPARTRVFVDFLVKTFGGEDRDPWLLAAGCETQALLRRTMPVQACLAWSD